MDKPAPRVNSSMLKSYAGEVVTLAGKVREIDGRALFLQASDFGEVTIKIPENFECNEYIEIIGKVEHDLTLTYFSHNNPAGEINLPNYDKAITLARKFPDVF